MTIEIKQLEKVFYQKGYLHVYCFGSEQDGGYVYAKHAISDTQSKDELLCMPCNVLIEKLGTPIGNYEVFLHKVRKETTMTLGGIEVNYPACVPYPSDNDFGATAWSCYTLERAKQKLKQEVERRKIEA